MPSSLVLAPQFEGYDPDMTTDASNFMAIWNLTGNPAMSICCGFSESNLPIGLQIVGKPFDEPAVFKVADAYQRITDWHTRKPSLAVEVAA
jgi:aspartyl-tRNA(Asn)/glutamyl-tRNA(Gln) amidotransferase subunit A